VKEAYFERIGYFRVLNFYYVSLKFYIDRKELNMMYVPLSCEERGKEDGVLMFISERKGG
jgi:hypothetical protein